MKVLVIGGCGFIGSHVVDRLLQHDHAVRVFDRQAERFRPPLAGVDYRYGDFADSMAVAESLTGMDAVFHLASTTVPGTANLDSKIDVQENLIGTIKLLESMKSLGPSRILFLSSGGTVYGVPDLIPTPETHALRPINSYGIIKAAIEHYLDMYRRTGSLSPVIIRASNPYGPRQAHYGVQGVISSFLRRILMGEPIEIWGDGTVVRDYLEVSDLADLCVRAGTSHREGPYNAGSGHGRSINEIVEAVRDVTSVEFKIVYKPARLIDIPRSVLDNSHAKTDFGWKCSTELATGLQNTWNWLRLQV
jgi:UDP-glucose 4-epimerase